MSVVQRVDAQILGEQAALSVGNGDTWTLDASNSNQLYAFRLLLAVSLDLGVQAQGWRAGQTRTIAATRAAFQAALDIPEPGRRVTEDVRAALTRIFDRRLGLTTPPGSRSFPLRHVPGSGWTLDNDHVEVVFDLTSLLDDCSASRSGAPATRAAALDRCLAGLARAFLDLDALALQPHLSHLDRSLYAVHHSLLSERVAVAHEMADAEAAARSVRTLASAYPSDLTSETIALAVRCSNDLPTALGLLEELSAALGPHDRRLASASAFVDSLEGAVLSNPAPRAFGPDELRTGRLCRVREVTGEQAGVHRALDEYCAGSEDGGSEAGLPPFVLRERQEEALQDRLQAVLTVNGGHVVVIRGESTAGKTRLALKVLKRTCPDAFFVAPWTAAIARQVFDPAEHPGVADSPGTPVIVWLDDVENFIAPGDQGLHAGHLAGLLHHQRPVVFVCTAGGRGQQETDDDALRADTLTHFLALGRPEVLVDRRVTDPTELRAIAEAFGPEIAVRASEDGLGAALIARDRVVERFEHGHRAPGTKSHATHAEGQALVDALLRWRATVDTLSVPDDLARELWGGARRRRGLSSRPSDSCWDDAAAWASFEGVPGHPLVAWDDARQGWDVSELLPIDHGVRIAEAFSLHGQPLEKWAAGNAERMGRLALSAHKGAHTTDAISAGQLVQQASDWYERAFAEGLSDPGYLGTYAVFSMQVRPDFDRARSLFDRALEVDGDHVINVTNYAIFLTDHLGEHDAAEALYRRAVAQESRNPYALVNYAIFLRDIRRQHDAACRLFERAIDADPSNVHATTDYAIYLTDVLGLHDRAESFYARVLEADPHNAYNLGNYAIFLRDIRRKHEAASEFFERAAAAEPGNAHNLASHAMSEAAAGRRAQAEALFDAALAAERHHPFTLLRYASFLLERGDETSLDQAVDLLDRLLDADGRSVGAYVGVASQLAAQQHLAHAERMYERAAATPGITSRQLAEYARFLTERRGDHALARSVFDRCLAEDAADTYVLGSFARMLCTIDAPVEDVIAIFEAALAVEPTSETNLTNYAIVLTDHYGLHDRAEDLYQSAITVDRPTTSSLSNYAIFQADVRGALDVAERLFEDALRLDPNDAYTLASLARFVRDHRRDSERADSLLLRARLADPQHRLGVVRDLLGLYSDGAAASAEALRRHLAAPDQASDIRLLCAFVAYLHGPGEARSARLAEIRKLVLSGVRVVGVTFDVPSDAVDESASAADLEALADVIRATEPAAILEAWPAWNNAS